MGKSEDLSNFDKGQNDDGQMMGTEHLQHVMWGVPGLQWLAPTKGDQREQPVIRRQSWEPTAH